MADENTIDLSTFVPETFKGEDGTFDTEGFRTQFDELSSFKAQYDEGRAALPEGPEGYEFALLEDHALPEGFDPEAMKTKDEEGNEVAFDPAAMIDAEDQDIAALQQAVHEFKDDPVMLTKKLAGIMVNREIRGMMDGMAKAAEEKKALGPQADARIGTVKRTLAGRLPTEQAGALLDMITSASALRGIEALIKNSSSPTPPAPGKQDMSELSIDERILLGIQQRKKSA